MEYIYILDKWYGLEISRAELVRSTPHRVDIANPVKIWSIAKYSRDMVSGNISKKSKDHDTFPTLAEAIQAALGVLVINRDDAGIAMQKAMDGIQQLYELEEEAQ
jgi:hypothetical protein